MVIENEYLRAEFLPEIGGKMIALVDRETKNQFLLESQLPGKAYKRAAYGARFEAYDTSGFDECFPTIEACTDQPMRARRHSYHVDFPDHGELWSRPWDHSIGDDELVFSISGVRANYRLQKKIKLADNRLDIHYRLISYLDEPLSYVWSAHPLLKVHPGSKVILPEKINRMFLSWASDANIGKLGDYMPWPFLSGVNTGIDFSIVQKQSLGVAAKCFSDRLSDGWAGVYDEETNQSIFFEFDPKEIPYLGTWLCYGGWPVGSRDRHLTVALEPCTGRPDSLSKAIQRHECTAIGPGRTREWTLEISLWQGLPSLQWKSGKFFHTSFSGL